MRWLMNTIYGIENRAFCCLWIWPHTSLLTSASRLTSDNFWLASFFTSVFLLSVSKEEALPIFASVHCKDKLPKIWNKYSQKRNIGVSDPISTFMCLWANYIFPWWVCLFCWRKYVDRSWECRNRYRQMNVEIEDEAAQFPEKEYINGITVAVLLWHLRYTRLRIFLAPILNFVIFCDFCKKHFWIRPLLGEIQLFRVVWD